MKCECGHIATRACSDCGKSVCVGCSEWDGRDENGDVYRCHKCYKTYVSPITDEMRLDWLTKNPDRIWFAHTIKSWVLRINGTYETPRQAIDAAIKAERKGAKK